MALTGTGSSAWDAMKAAGNSAGDAYLVVHSQPLSAAQVEEMVDLMRVAELNALFTHLQDNAVGSFAAQTIGVGLVAPSGGGPVTGTLTVTGGKVT